MAMMNYTQRRRSGVYEFRRRLPQRLAGKAVPAHVRDSFPDVPKKLSAELRKLPLPKLLERTDLAALPSHGATTVNKSVRLLGVIGWRLGWLRTDERTKFGSV
jgi:hypothetical protein